MSNASGRRTVNPATGLFFNRSAAVTLAGGKRYYVEVLHKEGGGSDSVGVAWQIPGGAAPVTNSAPIGADSISTLTNTVPAFVGGLPPDVNAYENDTVTFTPVPAVSPLRLTSGTRTERQLRVQTAPPTPLLSSRWGITALCSTGGYNAITSSPPATVHIAPDVTAPSVVASAGIRPSKACRCSSPNVSKPPARPIL